MNQFRTLAELYKEPDVWLDKTVQFDSWRKLLAAEMRKWRIWLRVVPEKHIPGTRTLDWRSLYAGPKAPSDGSWVELANQPQAREKRRARQLAVRLKQVLRRSAQDLFLQQSADPDEVRWFLDQIEHLADLQADCFTPKLRRPILVADLWANVLSHKRPIARHAFGIPLVLERVLETSIQSNGGSSWRDSANEMLEQLLLLRSAYCDVWDEHAAKEADIDRTQIRGLVLKRLSGLIAPHVQLAVDAVAWLNDSWASCVLDPFVTLYKIYSFKKSHGEILDAIHQPLAEQMLAKGITRDQVLKGLEKCTEAINREGHSQPESQLDVPQHEIERIIDEAGLPSPEVLRLLESGEFARFVRRQRENLYRVKCNLDYRYMFKRLFGLKTGMRGLDYLFYGGLLLREDKGSAILLRGKPGNGKSTFALHLLSELSKAGAICLYYTVEEDLREIERLVNVFSLRDEDCMDFCIRRSDCGSKPSCASSCRISDVVEKAASRGRGLLRISELLSHDFLSAGTIVADDLREVAEAIEQGRKDGRRPKVVVAIDSLGAVPYPGDDGDDGEEDGVSESPAVAARQEFVKRITRLRSQVSLCVMVSEASEHSQEFESYVSDGIINFGTMQVGPSGTKVKTIEIEKARFQEVHHEAHPFSLEDGAGCVIYPAVASILRARERRVESSRQVYFPTGIDGLDRALGGGGLARETVTLCLGRSGIGKSVVALHCLLSAQHQDDQWTAAGEERILMVSFRSRSPLPVLGHNLDYLCRRHARKLCHGAIEELRFPPSTRTPEEILGRVIDTLADARNLGEPISRVVVVDVDHARTNLLAMTQEDLFTTALLAVLRTASVTALITCGADMTEVKNPVIALRNNIHNLIHFRKIGVQGEERRGITVEMSASDEHSPRFFELVETGDQCNLEDRFQRYMGFDTDNAVAVPITVYMYEETAEQRNYNDRLKQELGMALQGLDDQRSFRLERSYPGSAPFIRAALEVSSNSPKSTLRLFCVDEYQLAALRESHLEYLPDNIGDTSQGNAPLTTIYSNRLLNAARDPVTGRLCAIPYYQNATVLCYDRKKLGNDEAGLLAAADNVESLNEYLGGLGIALDFPAFTDQNYNVFFLGLLLDVTRSRTGDAYWCLRKCFESEDLVIETARLAQGLVGSRPLALMDANQDTHCSGSSCPERNRYGIETGELSPVSRQWISTIPLFARTRNIDISEVGVCCNPGIAFTGDWYLAVEKGSAALDYAWRILRELTSYRENQLRLRAGVGAPARKDATADSSRIFNVDSRKFSALHDSAVRRGSFGCYYAVSDWLAQHVRGIMAAESEGERDARARALWSRSKRFRYGPYCETCSRSRSSRCTHDEDA